MANKIVNSILEDMLQISRYCLALKAYKHGYFLDQARAHAWEAGTLHRVLKPTLWGYCMRRNY